MSFLDKLFKRKVDELMSDIKRSESLLDDAEKELIKLKRSPKRLLLREELLRTICRYGDLNRQNGIYRGENYASSACIEMESQIDKVTIEINELLNELCEVKE